jgi:predicted ATP-dependent Lon-type protease
VKGNAIVPIYVSLEYLLNNTKGCDDEETINEGVETVKKNNCPTLCTSMRHRLSNQT